jgi:hypothetical protein
MTLNPQHASTDGAGIPAGSSSSSLSSHFFRRSAISLLQSFRKSPFGCLLTLFLTRMFQGNSDSSDDLNLGIAAILSLLAVPGMLISMLMFEKYGSLLRFIRGGTSAVFDFDPFVAAIPDEYFFVVLSIVITGAATLWRWDAIFLDRRDYTNLVPLPIPLKTLFTANFCAVFVLAAVFAIVVNAASVILFPIVVVGSQDSFALLCRFAAGHAIDILLASIFSFFAVFAIAGALMSVLPTQVFRRVSLFVRFIIGIALLLLLATAFAVPDLLEHSQASAIRTLIHLPPVSFLGIARIIWVRAHEPFVTSMAAAALLALAATIAIATIAYAVSFRRAFLGISETSDAGPLPRFRFSLPIFSPLSKLILRSPSQRACFHFSLNTLLRSEAHLQTVLAFVALGLVAAAESLNSPQGLTALITAPHPTVEFLAVPFILSYTLIVGIRCTFEMPADLRANWIFRMWLDPESQDARPVARLLTHTLTTSWLAPLTFFATLRFFSPTDAAFHSAILIAANTLLVEILLANFRKIPFTCAYPAFESRSGIILLAYLLAFLIFTNYIPALEYRSFADPVRALVFLPLLAIPFAAVHIYRRQLLDMDKTLLFESVETTL